MIRKVENIADRCGPKRINRLGIIADDRQSPPLGLRARRIEACRRLVS